FALAAFDGTVTAFDGPARQSFVSELVPLPQLANAIGLNSSSWNAARLFGPAVAGLLIAVFGTGHAFAINACSFLVMIVMLIRMDPSQFYGSKADGRAAKGAGAQLAEVADPSSAGSDQRSPADAASGHNQTRSATNRRSGGLSAGLRYVFDRPFLTLLFFIAFMMGTFGFNYNITNTLMSTTVFDRGPGEYGLLGSVMGIGSLTGALLSARRDRPRLRLIVIFLAGFALSLVASALAPNFIAFAATMVPIGLCSVTVMVVANSMVQISIPQSVRGRVMALWGVATLGLTPAVSPILGWVGDHLGARATVWVGAGAIGLTALAVAWYLITKQQIRVDRHGHVRSSRAWEVRSH
ncbi:MAG: MFS transporter, partial [Propionibacteriaceae bacterium]|nr:MFS transporter [Propionibacteriaceae bacterium]